MTNDQLNIAELPELPEPEHDLWTTNGFTTDQMRSYALAAQAPLLAELRLLVERIKELEKQNAELRGLPAILREAANILNGERLMRNPIVDELDGFASMLEHAAANQGGHQNG